MLSKKFNLKSVPLPKMLADLKHANQFLKIFSLLALSLLVLESSAIILLLNSSVKVIAFDSLAQKVEFSEKPRPEREIEMAIREYIRHRYSWTPGDVTAKLKAAGSFISSSIKPKYFESVGKVAQFSRDRSVFQAAYVDKIDIDLKSGVARVTGSRVTSIQNLKAAGDLKVTLFFESSTRTSENPWGIYIRQEKEDASN